VELVDTVYLVVFLNPDDPRHGEAVELLSGLGASRRVSQAALIELDLLMKLRGFSPEERGSAWLVLAQVVPENAVEPLVPRDFAVAVELREAEGLDYFDTQCAVRGTKLVTTEAAIFKVLEREAGGWRLASCSVFVPLSHSSRVFYSLMCVMPALLAILRNFSSNSLSFSLHPIGSQLDLPHAQTRHLDAELNLLFLCEPLGFVEKLLSLIQERVVQVWRCGRVEGVRVGVFPHLRVEEI